VFVLTGPRISTLVRGLQKLSRFTATFFFPEYDANLPAAMFELEEEVLMHSLFTIVEAAAFTCIRPVIDVFVNVVTMAFEQVKKRNVQLVSVLQHAPKLAVFIKHFLWV
jgi:hypothetical protein